MRRPLVLLLTLALVLLAVTPSGVVPVQAQDVTPSNSPSPAHGRFSDQVDIGGRSLRLTFLGEGRPTVLLESDSPFTHLATTWGAYVGRIGGRRDEPGTRVELAS
jgi:hypothetical protein